MNPAKVPDVQGSTGEIGVGESVGSLVQPTLRAVRILVLAGVPTGVLVLGVGSRLAMLALRATSSPSVKGVKSDDGFVMGRFTMSGTYNLLLLGAAIGIIGAAAYQWVRPWLIGPKWFRSFTLALAAGAVVGSMLVHADGIDFKILDPLWFAIALFVALPALFAVTIGWAVDYVERSPVPVGRRRWVVPALLSLAFPLTLLILVVAVCVTAAWMSVRQTFDVAAFAARPAVAFAMRAMWLAVAVFGAFALAGDISDLREIN